jgi:hypothetical protein
MNAVTSRIGAACGAVFAIVLTIANGDGTQPLPVGREVAALLALALAIPFLVYVGAVLRAHSATPWLVQTAVASGVAGIALKLASSAPDIAVRRAGLIDGTTLHDGLLELGGALTILSLYPLAVSCLVTAGAAWESAALPRWLCVGAAVTGLALIVNGALVETDFMFGLLLFTLWSLVAGIHLVRVARRPVLPTVGNEATLGV